VATPTPVPAPAPKSGGALKIVLIVLGVIAAIIILIAGLLAYGCYRIAHSIAHSEHGKSTISIPGAGTMSTSSSSSFTAADLGTDIYPGATPGQGGLRMETPEALSVNANYETTDPVAKVEAFYKEKFGSDATDLNMGSTVLLTKKMGDKEVITVTINGQGDGKTKIMIGHTKKK